MSTTRVDRCDPTVGCNVFHHITPSGSLFVCCLSPIDSACNLVSSNHRLRNVVLLPFTPPHVLELESHRIDGAFPPPSSQLPTRILTVLSELNIELKYSRIQSRRRIRKMCKYPCLDTRVKLTLIPSLRASNNIKPLIGDGLSFRRTGSVLVGQ